jgi:endoglucanase
MSERQRRRVMSVLARRYGQFLCCLALLCLIFAASAGPLSSESPFTKGRTGGGILMGAYDPYGTFANDAKISIEHIFIPWKDVNLTSLDAADKYARDRSRKLLITVEPWTWSRNGKAETSAELYAGIMAGNYDQLIRELCRKGASLKSDITIRWGQEMDLGNDRYPWSEWAAVEYINAYRHFVDTCRTVGAGIHFMWSPRGEPSMREYYPGSDYVDSIGLTLFGFQEYEIELYGKDLTLPERLGPSYELVADLGKDIYIAEFGCHGDQAYLRRCVEEARSVSAKFSRISAVIYFNEVETYKWPGSHGSPDWRIMSKLFAELLQ